VAKSDRFHTSWSNNRSASIRLAYVVDIATVHRTHLRDWEWERGGGRAGGTLLLAIGQLAEGEA